MSPLPESDVSREIAGGVLCVATLFASVSALNQAWAREIRHQVLDALRMTPSGGAAPSVVHLDGFEAAPE